MTIKRLNVRGFSHGMVLAAFVLVFGVLGVALFVNSHAQTGWTLIGSKSIPSRGETVSVYSCTSNLSSSIARLDAQYRLSNKIANTAGVTWTATVLNVNPTKALSGWGYVADKFTFGSSPGVVVPVEYYRSADNFIEYAYQYKYPNSPETSGIIKSGIHPSGLKTC